MTTTTLIPNHAINNRSRDVQTAEIADQTWVFRSRTWDRLKFEIEYARQRGTTANSYLICGDKTALIDPPGESFTEIYGETFAQTLKKTKKLRVPQQGMTEAQIDRTAQAVGRIVGSLSVIGHRKSGGQY